jgi:hypothetical protein
MRRFLLILFFTLPFVGSAGSAQAGWTEFWCRFHLDYHRMKCWPEPFVRADRQAVRAPFEVMANNGWRSQTTMGDCFFDQETQQLTKSGELKLRWIVTEAPVDRRTVFVLRGHSPEATSIRVDSVQQAVVRILPEGPLPPVLITDTAPRGGSGDYLDHIDRTYRSSLPAPHLPAAPGEGEN